MKRGAAYGNEKALQYRVQVEAVKLVKDRSVSVSQASRDLDLNESVLGRWIKELAQYEQYAFPGSANMKPEQA